MEVIIAFNTHRGITMKTLALILLMISSSFATAGLKEEKNNKQWSPERSEHFFFKRKLVLENGYHHKIRSNFVDEIYKIYVLLPENYDSRKEGGYPVFYLLDADYFTHALHHSLKLNTTVPDSIIVGIGYEDLDPDGTKRIRDYSPTTVDDYPNSGGAENFRSMLVNELMPKIDRYLNINPDQETLVTWSMSGLFALHTMFNYREMFDNYIVASPYLPWDEYMIFNEEAEFANANNDLEAKLFLSVGELEPIETTLSPFNALVQTLEARNYPSLLIEDRTIEGEAHNTMVAPSFNKGLRHVFSDIKSVNLGDDVLGEYEAIYDFFPGVSIAIQVKGELLVAQVSGSNGFEMYPQAIDEFFSKMIPGLSVSFVRNEAGEVNQIIYDSPTLGYFVGTRR